MTPSEHIINCLQELKADPLEEINNQKKIVDLIYGFLMSKKFRKYAVTPEYQKYIRDAISSSVSKHEPIKLVLVFGGYKLWRLEEAPEVDWAELFSLIYYAKWLKPILAIYRPGVWFDFYSNDVVVEIMNNIPKEDTEKYARSFKKLLEFIKLYIPKNLSSTLNRVGDQYDSYEDFKKELEQNIDQLKVAGGNTPLSEDRKTTVELNVKPAPNQTADPLWREKVSLIHDAFFQTSKVRPYYHVPEKISVITRPSRSVRGSLAVGTTKRSVVKFWIGVGALGQEGDDYVDYILSPKQLTVGSFSTQDVYIEKLTGQNFKKIKILKK